MKTKGTMIITAVGFFLMLAIVRVSAQAPTAAQVNIPFDFSAGNSALKAGTYTIARTTGSILKLRSADGEKTVLINAPLTIGSRDFKAGERLVFNRYGKEYFLTQVWLTADAGRQLLPSKAEMETSRGLAKLKGEPKRVEIALRGR
ncbi:MAG TPA: hypothetical protein VL866_16545 [Pyrinomonadaceae bacterium]|nr:hypothetical protein [Pyrinomonadaceae bacterium]